MFLQKIGLTIVVNFVWSFVYDYFFFCGFHVILFWLNFNGHLWLVLFEISCLRILKSLNLSYIITCVLKQHERADWFYLKSFHKNLSKLYHTIWIVFIWNLIDRNQLVRDLTQRISSCDRFFYIRFTYVYRGEPETRKKKLQSGRFNSYMHFFTYSNTLTGFYSVECKLWKSELLVQEATIIIFLVFFLLQKNLVHLAFCVWKNAFISVKWCLDVYWIVRNQNNREVAKIRIIFFCSKFQYYPFNNQNKCLTQILHV